MVTHYIVSLTYHNMNLFEDEKILTTTDSNIVVLTTHRIRSSNSVQWGQHSTVSIMLEKVSSIQATYNSYPLLLVLAGIMVLGAMILGNQRGSDSAIALPIVLAIVFVIAYFVTRRHICIVASDGGAKLAFETSRMGKDVLLRFIDQIEQAKSKRISQLTLHNNLL